jgi:protein-disulfide isomerase
VDLREALVNGTFAPKVRADFLGGVRSGVNGTPTFFINGERHDGSFALEDLSEAIEAHLTAKVPL